MTLKEANFKKALISHQALRNATSVKKAVSSAGSSALPYWRKRKSKNANSIVEDFIRNAGLENQTSTSNPANIHNVKNTPKRFGAEKVFSGAWAGGNGTDLFGNLYEPVNQNSGNPQDKNRIKKRLTFLFVTLSILLGTLSVGVIWYFDTSFKLSDFGL